MNTLTRTLTPSTAPYICPTLTHKYLLCRIFINRPIHEIYKRSFQFLCVCSRILLFHIHLLSISFESLITPSSSKSSMTSHSIHISTLNVHIASNNILIFWSESATFSFNHTSIILQYGIHSSSFLRTAQFKTHSFHLQLHSRGQCDWNRSSIIGWTLNELNSLHRLWCIHNSQLKHTSIPSLSFDQTECIPSTHC